MTHYDEADWSDWLRGLVDEAGAREMEGHLAAGCGRCGALVSALRRVRELAAAEARQRPAGPAVRLVKALFAVQRAERLPAWRRLALELIDGGPLAPAAAGVRGGPAGQQFTYAGGSLELGLMLRAVPGRESLSLGGELVDGRRGHLAGVPAFLVCGGEVVDRAMTDELGCFRLSAERSPDRLCLVLDDDRLLELELHGPAEPTGAWTVRPGRS